MTEIKVEQVQIGDIKENPLNRAIFNNLEKDKYDALKEYIKKTGLLKPVIVNGENVLLAGHERLKICRELGFKSIPVQRIDLGDLGKEQEFLIKDNVLSRNLSPIEVGKAGMHLEKIVKTLAKQGAHVRDIVAKTLGVSSFQYAKIKAVLLVGGEDLIRRVDKGEVSVARAYSLIKQERDRAQLKKMMLGEDPRFRLINEDPLATLQNFRPESCDCVIAEPPEGYNPIWVDLTHAAMKDGASLFIFTQAGFDCVGNVLEAGFKMVVPICVLGKTHQDGRFIYNHRMLLWFSKGSGYRVNEERVSTVWDFRSAEDPLLETFARVVSLTTSPADLVIHLFGDNGKVKALHERLHRHVFSIQPDREQYLREKLKA
jgi:hypothetical protein